jgi:hypothetical protein
MLPRSIPEKKSNFPFQFSKDAFSAKQRRRPFPFDSKKKVRKTKEWIWLPLSKYVIVKKQYS